MWFDRDDDDFEFSISQRSAIVSRRTKIIFVQDGSTHMLPVINRNILQHLQERREKNGEMQHNEAISSKQP